MEKPSQSMLQNISGKLWPATKQKEKKNANCSESGVAIGLFILDSTGFRTAYFDGGKRG